MILYHCISKTSQALVLPAGYLTAPMSSGHLNPVITLAQALSGHAQYSIAGDLPACPASLVRGISPGVLT